MTKLLTSSALALIASAGLVAAQDISGTATVGYGRTDVSDTSTDLDSITFDGNVAATFDNGLLLGARATAMNASIDDAPDLNASLLGASGGYRLGSGLRGGAYYERAHLGFAGMSGTANSYGATVGYDFAAGTVEGFYGRSAGSDLGDLNVHDYGVTGRYTAMDGLTFGGNLMRTNIALGGEDENLDLVGLAAVYDVAPAWTVFGGLTRSSIADTDVTTFGLGASYDLSGMVAVPTVLSLELARTNLDSDDLDADGHGNTVRLGVTFPFGQTGSKLPANSVAGAVMTPSHSAVTQTVLSAF
ncbi:porin [Sinirhodobacter huangdaonensis]|uniref:Porin n=1 Tax=Paenirhodobacter huangdaonensis TaxID=2501515 RepID=A0A443M014_9RHOB|nr:porin [Sinirhodobacter huangdaonensis]RWR54853.1 porin [Sinirhodobacter huangdaonensis]